MRKAITISAIVVVFSLTIGAFLLGFNPFTQSSGDYRSYGDAESLVNSSDRIVFVKYLGGKTHVIDRKNAHDGTMLGDITLLVRRFEIIESLKGDAGAGEITYVAVETADSLFGWKMANSIEYVRLSVGENYLLFLRAIPSRQEYEGQYGGVVWAHEFEPSIAQVDPDTGNLRFKTTTRYQNDRGVLSPSGAPFQLNREEILELVSPEAIESGTKQLTWVPDKGGNHMPCPHGARYISI